jgi:hypothetical protein
MNEYPEKQIIFRLPDDLKINLKIMLAKNHLCLQHVYAAFSEALIAYDRGEKMVDPFQGIIRRSHILSGRL